MTETLHLVAVGDDKARQLLWQLSSVYCDRYLVQRSTIRRQNQQFVACTCIDIQYRTQATN